MRAEGVAKYSETDERGSATIELAATAKVAQPATAPPPRVKPREPEGVDDFLRRHIKDEVS